MPSTVYYCTDPIACLPLFLTEHSTLLKSDCFVENKLLNFSSVQETGNKVSFLLEKDESYRFDFFIFRHAWEIITNRKNDAESSKIP